MIIKHIAGWLLMVSLAGFIVFMQQIDVKAGDQSPVVANEEAIKDISPWSVVVDRNWKSWSNGQDRVTKSDLIAKAARPEYRGGRRSSSRSS